MSENYTYICPEEECTGCMACLNVCNFSAIDIIEDELGFRYPVIDDDKCTGCGLCRRVCPQLERRELAYPQKCYAAAMRDDGAAMSCASGGVASALGHAFIAANGVVAGCCGEDIGDVRHTIAVTPQDLERLKKSKYVQSRIPADFFREIRSRLLNDENVLFIGTGCQVAGLRNFLIKDYDNLTTVDLVCHGVPSQQLLSDDLRLYPPLENGSVGFRRKVKTRNGKVRIKYGLSALTESGNGEKGRRLWKPWYTDPYMGAFISGVGFRQGCFSCLYARPERGSDITLCDYWGLGKDSRLNGKPGVSAVLVNTAKGERALSLCEDLLELEKRTVEEAVAGNGQLQRPSASNPRRDRFVKEYMSHGIKTAYRKTVCRDMLKKEAYETVRAWLLPLYPIYKLIRRK